MKIQPKTQGEKTAGSALLLTMILSTIALALLASIMLWSSSSARLTHRSIEYTRSVAAAEAATEKVISQMTQDFLYGGALQVSNNMNFYRQSTVPTAADSAYWATWVFNDGLGNTGQTYVQLTNANSYVVLDSTYAGLKAYTSTYIVVSHASDSNSSQGVPGGVYQELQLAQIPIFQFAMYSSGNMEISCGQAFDITGRVHSNQILYVEPDSSLTFESAVTAVVSILFQRDPLDPRGLTPNGTVLYQNPDEKTAPVTALTLPIGTTNTPEGIREIIEPPPPGEDPNSPLGKLRYYNQCDMLVLVSNTSVTASSGDFNGFATQIPPTDLPFFVSTGSSFVDNREGKTVQPVDINIGNLATWGATNNTLRSALGGAILSSIYVADYRTLPSTSLNAVRVVNGAQLPTNGLTVATGQPLYVEGDYNSDVANRGTANTSNTRPASLAADAITILSDAWQDGTTGSGVSPPTAAPTTVNAALLTGAVETTTAAYSGGMENFPRFLENWGKANTFTYNGSMIKMFPSLHATGIWGQANVYNPPARNWAYDLNFDDPTKLPPKTPSLLKVLRNKWSTAVPGQNIATTYP